MKRWYSIPPYGATIYVMVGDDIARMRRKMADMFGPVEPDDSINYFALSSYDGKGHFGLFFTPESLTLKVIAHEVFHVAHRLSDWAGLNFDQRHHEATAALCEHIFDIVERATRPLREAYASGAKRRPVKRPGRVPKKRVRPAHAHRKHRTPRNGGSIPVSH